MTCIVSGGALNSTHSLGHITHSATYAKQSHNIDIIRYKQFNEQHIVCKIGSFVRI